MPSSDLSRPIISASSETRIPIIISMIFHTMNEITKVKAPTIAIPTSWVLSDASVFVIATAIVPQIPATR